MQGVNVSSSLYGNGFVSVKCVFIQGSPIEECHVVFTDMAQGLQESFNITGSEETLVSLSVSGNYTVRACDIFNSTIVGSCVVYPILVEIIVILMLTPSPVITSLLHYSIIASKMLQFSTSEMLQSSTSEMLQSSTMIKIPFESTSGTQFMIFQ